MSVIFCTDYGAFTTDTWQCKTKFRSYFTVLRKFNIHYLMACRRCYVCWKAGNIIYAGYCHKNVGKATHQRNVNCIKRRRERQEREPEKSGEGNRKRMGERKKEEERTLPLIILEYGNLHSQICGFLHCTFLDGSENPITANLNLKFWNQRWLLMKQPRWLHFSNVGDTSTSYNIKYNIIVE